MLLVIYIMSILLINEYSKFCMNDYIEINIYQDRLWIDYVIKEYLCNIDAEAITEEQFEIYIREHLKVELILKNV